MGVETATYISQLSATNPLGTDPISEGDDQIRLVKEVLQAQFTSLGAAAVTATATELNLIDGYTGTTAELNTLDVTTQGTSEASKVLTADANGDVTIADGAYDFDVASHDGTNGLLLGGTLVTASATEVNLLDGKSVVGDAVLATDQSWTGSQRATAVTDNDGSYDMDAGQNFITTPSGATTITFTNITDGQSGFIKLINSGGETISLHANSKGDANIASTVSTTGTYLLSYFSDGTDVWLTNSAIYA